MKASMGLCGELMEDEAGLGGRVEDEVVELCATKDIKMVCGGGADGGSETPEAHTERGSAPQRHARC